MSSELERQRARVAQLEGEVGPLATHAPHETMDVAPYRRKIMSLRAEKNHILAAEKERLVHEYERRLAADRAVLHDRLQRELAFRERNAFAGSTKPNAAYGGLLNPPKIGGDTGPKSEAFLRAKNEFKCVSEDAVPGYVVTRVLGAVCGSGFIAGSPEPELENVDLSRSDRASAVNHMVETAIDRGANAVIGLRFDTSAPIGTSHIEVLAYGTAVNIKRDNGKGQNWDGGHKHVSFKEESLQEILKRVLSEEDGGGGGGGKKKNKQPEAPTEDEVSFSQIQAMMALLAGKGAAPSGGGGSGNGFGGWGTGGNSTNAWGDTAASSGGGTGTWGTGNTTADTGWGDTAGTKAWSGDNKQSSSSGSWGAPGDTNATWGGAAEPQKDDWGGQGSGGDSWGGGGGFGHSNDDDRGPGGWANEGRRNDRGGADRQSYSPDMSPRELAFMLSDFAQRMKGSSGRRRPRRDEPRSSRRAEPSPIFGWEAF